MSFLHPALLWLLPLAAVPIILHLLTLHRLKTVELSTFRFLFDSYVQQRRKMQFLEALLAMLRTLFLLLLIMLVCRPAVRHWNEMFSTGSGREILLLVDCSASMNAKTGGLSAIDRAKNAALAIVDRLGPEDRLTLVRVVAKPEELFSRFAQDAAPLRERIESLRPTPSRANFFAALSQLFGPGAEQHDNASVYLMTDCQSSGWREARDQGLHRLVPEGTPVYVVNVGSKEPIANLAVLGNAPRRSRVVAGLPVVLQPRVVNNSKTETADATLSVLIDEKEIARAPLTLKPGETVTRKIVYVPNEPGTLKCRFEISSKSGDAFPDDNQFLFALSVVPRLRVLLVNGNPSGDPFENEALYMRTALTVEPESKRDDPAMTKLGATKEALRFLDVREIAEGQLNPDELRDTSVAVLCDCGGLNATHFGWLRDFVSTGGGLLIFPGQHVNAEVYNTQFFPQPGPQGEKLIGARLKNPEGDPEKIESYEQFAVLDFAHPVLSVFDDPESRDLRTAHFGRRFPITLPEKSDDTWALARFRNGSPALVESRFHDGLVMLAAFPANARWTNLPLKPEFVPLVLRMVTHAEHRPTLEVPSVVPVQAAAEVSVVGSWAPVTGKVTDPAGRSTPLAFERSASRLVGAYEQTDQHGFYAVEVAGGRRDGSQGASAAFAVNLAPDESEFDSLSESQFRDLLPGTKLTMVDASAEAQQLFGSIGDEREVWRPLIFILFAIICVEFSLATLSGQRRDGESPETVTERIRRFRPGSWVGRMTGAGQLKT